MGAGIAQVAAEAGLDVALLDPVTGAYERARDRIGGFLERKVTKGQLHAGLAEAAMGRIHEAGSVADLAAAEFVIEAIPEELDLKRDAFRRLDAAAAPSTIRATNTSSLSVGRIAEATARPERVVGMHFFNPVPVMALVELIRGLQTSDSTQAAAEAFVARIHKTAISARNSPGFAVNRILVPMINEAVFVLQEGLASAEHIDDGMRLGCNHPIGPLALADLIGLDTLLAVMEVFYHSFNDCKYRPAPLLREMVEAGYLGRKSGRGFYRYA